MRHTNITIGGQRFALAHNDAVEELMATALSAVHEGGGYINFAAVGNRHVTILLPAGVVVIFDESDDSRDTNDDRQDASALDAPYDDMYLLDL